MAPESCDDRRLRELALFAGAGGGILGSNRGGARGRVGPKRPSLRGHLGGSPNPDWLDWYVGLPIGWSGLQPLGTYKFQQWLKQHGSC